MDETTRATAAVASPAEIRSHFPALERRHAGHPVAYFDGPGGTQVPRQVADAVFDYLLHHNANTHWAYPTSAETDAALAGARGAVADFLNAESDEIAFGANMTTLTFHLARALGREWGPGDEVVVTELDHHANVAPWQRLAAERGVTVRTVRMVPETGQLDWAHFEQVVTPRTRLVAAGAASNALGTISDIPRAVSLAHDAGALAFVDAVHYAPHELVDVRALGCDFLCCSAYKFYGPHVGVMFGRRDRFATADFPKLIPAPDTPPEMAETGTLNHEGIVGAGAAVDFLASLAEGPTRRARLEAVFARFHARGIEMARCLWQGLEGIGTVRLFGPTPDLPRTPTVSFVVRGVPSCEVARRLADRGLFLSHGDFYAKTVIERLGQAPGGIVRAGCACYATAEEVDRLVKGVRGIAA
jgi:cysteine desulfurase family protein (TIGR01976 family)